MRIAKKALSVFLSLLMVFSACAVGFPGLAVLANAAGSKYEPEEVIALVEAATKNGFDISSSNDKWEYASDDGSAILAAEAIFDYAVKTYREGKADDAAGNTSEALYKMFMNEFSGKFTNAAAADRLVKNVLYPDGTTVYSVDAKASKQKSKAIYQLNKKDAEYNDGDDVSGTYSVSAYPDLYASSASTVTKTVSIQINMDDYLLTFESLDDVPATFLSSVSYTYSHAAATTAVIANKVEDGSTGSGCNKVTRYSYDINTTYWNYMSAKPVRTVVKDKTTKKELLSIEKFFTPERLAESLDSMLALSGSEITSYRNTANGYYTAFKKYSKAVIDNFNLNYDGIVEFMENLEFAYQVTVGMNSVDILLAKINSNYDVNSYSSMNSLYNQIITAKNFVNGLPGDVVEYLNENGYAEKYANVKELLAGADDYINTLKEVMTEQKLEEYAASMRKTYNDYYSLLDKEDIEKPTDAEVIGLVQKVAGYDSVLSTYTGKSYYRTYWTTDDEANWASFKTKLAEVYEVRGLKDDFNTYYEYFMPIIFTNKIADLSSEDAMALYDDLGTKLEELKASYNAIVSNANWGKTIADKIFTINYEGQDWLLQDLIESVKSTGLEAVKTVLVARTETQLDNVYAYKDTTVVNFDNFAEIKSTLTYFDEKLYSFVKGKGWLSDEYTAKYSEVANLLSKYHKFSEPNGKEFFNEDFTFADVNGIFATRYAGSQFIDVVGEDEDGNSVTTQQQIGYPNDIARDGAEDNYVVTEKELVQTVEKIDSFIVSRDFGALVGFIDEDTEEATDLATYIEQMLNEMLFNDTTMNTLVAAIFPMLCELIEEKLVGALGEMKGSRLDEDGVPWLDLSVLADDIEVLGQKVTVTGELGLFLDKAEVPNNPGEAQKNFMEVFADLGLNIYPKTLAESLKFSNPASYGVDTDIYKTLRDAGSDWTALLGEEETLNFAWGVYDRDSFIEVMGCILDAILPLLQAVLTTEEFNNVSTYALVAYSDYLKATALYNIVNITAEDTYISGDLRITIPGLDAWSTIFTPLFEVLGVKNIPTVSGDASGDDISNALLGTLLDRVDEILASPLSNVLDILPNLVYFLSMDTVQEMINSLTIKLNLSLDSVDVYASTQETILGYLEGTLADAISFDVKLVVAELLDLYDLLGFEISDFNEVLKFATENLGISLPPINQEEIIFCSDWTTNAAGRVDLQANEGDLLYWFIEYLILALEDGKLLESFLGSDMNATVKSVIDTVVKNFTGNPRDGLAAIVELINPVEYDLLEPDWVESTWNYGDIAGANQMSVVYLNYGNDWTQDDAKYLVDNVDSIIASVLEMTGSDIEDLGAYLQDKVKDLFTNENITSLVEMLGGFGDSPSAVMADILEEQIGIDIEAWFVAFGYLFPEGTWAEDAEIILPTSNHYVNEFGVEGTKNADGTITWSYKGGITLKDGDGYAFINILTRLLSEASLVVKFLFAGADIAAFEDLLTVKGYESYASTLGHLLTILGVENLPTQEAFNADPMNSLFNTLTAVLDRFYELTDSDNMVAQIVELIPDLFYYIESNGLATLLHNLLQPVLVLVDTVRPLMDVDINGILSLVVSDFINYGDINTDTILTYLLTGVYNNNDADYVYYSVSLNNLKLSEIIKLADIFFGSNLYESGLVQIGIKGLCSGVETVTGTVAGDIYTTTVTAADAITIIVTGLLDCLNQPAKDTQYTNGDVIFTKLAELTGNDTVADIYSILVEIITGINYEYVTPEWGYMFKGSDEFSLTLPEQSIAYLGYTTDWTKDTAKAVYGVLDEVLELVLPEVLDEGETLATLIYGLLEDNVYSNSVLNAVVELLVNAIAGLDETLRDTVDVVLDTNIAAWFAMCKLDEATGKYVCTKEWGIDTAAAADKKAMFVAGIKEVLAPANELLAWFFFGDDYSFFTGSEKNEDGTYAYNDLLTLPGGQGYAYGLAPILEALGCELKTADQYYNAETKTYNVGNAVEDILNAVLAVVDKLTANTVEEAFKLIPNLIYFINADGLVASVNNLLAPINTVLNAASNLTDGFSIAAVLKDEIGLDITNLSTETLLGLAADKGVKISPDMLNIICELYVGKLSEFTSVNGNKAYRLDVTGAEGDVLTLILSIALDLFNLNPELFSELLGEEEYYAVYNLIRGAAEEFTYREMNWAYMYDGEDAATKLYNNNLPERTGDAVEIYTQYQNNWNQASADYLDEVLDELVKNITDAARSDGSTLGKLLDNAISKGLYQDDILNSLIEMVVELLVDYEDLISGAGAILGAEGIAEWFDYCEITKVDGETVVECTKDWGIDSAANNDAKREAFVDGFVTALKPAYRLLAWLLFGEDYTFFNGTTNEVLVTVTGGNGYDNAIVPLLEGVSASMNGTEGTYLDGKSAIKPASAYYVDGELNMEMAVRDVFTAVTDWLYDICGDLSNQAEDGALTSMLDKLANFIYFVNADGLKVVVNNLLVPVNNLVDSLAVFDVKLDIDELVGLEITDVDFYDLFDLLEDLLGLYFPDYTQEFLATFYIGEVVPYASANGKLAYYMTYSEEETRSDMITCVISFVVDAFEDPRNDEVLIGWLGEDAYEAIINVLNITEAKDMQEFSWLYTEYADTDEIFTPIESSVTYGQAYDAIWTEEMAEYISDNLVDFTTKIISLLGLEINGYEIRSLEDLINSYLNGDLYTQATADTVLDFFKNLTDLFGAYAPVGEKAIKLLDKAIGTSMSSWATMEVTVEDGNRESFVAALKQILAPIVPLLDALLCGEDLTFFYSAADKSAQITIPGSAGYAYGIVPLLEALGCTMLTPDEFYALEDDAKIGAILDAVLDRVDTIMLDPVNEIFAMLPAIFYFINSNGLDTSVKNIINTVDTVLAALEPALGAPDLMTLLGIDLADYDFAYLAQMLADMISDETGMETEALIVDAVAELTMGKVVSYPSANGETYYTMVYANDEQLKDMVTVVLRLAVDFISTAENADAIAALLVKNTENEEAADSVRSFISLVLQGLSVKPATSGSMATIYYIFYGLKQGVDVIYGNYYDSWSAIRDLLTEDERPVVDKLVTLVGGILGDFAGFENGSDSETCDCNCHSTNAVVSLIHTILNLIRRIFNQTEYQYCACGVNHWDFQARANR